MAARRARHSMGDITRCLMRPRGPRSLRGRRPGRRAAVPSARARPLATLWGVRKNRSWSRSEPPPTPRGREHERGRASARA